MGQEVITGQEYLRLIGRKNKRKSKYNNQRVTVDGYTFDSKMEAEYYHQLKLRKRANDIKDFKLQPRYLLQESFSKDAKRYNKIEYVADFEIIHNDGTIEVIDVKGVRTQVFNIKKKMFHKRYPHKLTLISREDI